MKTPTKLIVGVCLIAAATAYMAYVGAQQLEILPDRG